MSEDGEWSPTTVGTPQGAVISPLYANVFLHYVFDLWINEWRKREAQGEVTVIRYADDFVIGFREESDPEDPSSLSKCAVCQSTSKERAVCGSSARTELCGGRSAMTFPTAMCVGVSQFSEIVSLQMMAI